jgi:hypothetical protein
MLHLRPYQQEALAWAEEARARSACKLPIEMATGKPGLFGRTPGSRRAALLCGVLVGAADYHLEDARVSGNVVIVRHSVATDPRINFLLNSASAAKRPWATPSGRHPPSLTNYRWSRCTEG